MADGTLAKTLDSTAVAANGTVTPIRFGTLAQTVGLTSAASGVVTPIRTGELTKTIGCTVASSGVVTPAPWPVLYRVQAKIATAGPVSTMSWTFDTPPAVGNGIVVALLAFRQTSLHQAWINKDWACVDNRGHLYYSGMPAIDPGNQTNLGYAKAWFCPVVTASGDPFTITVTTDPWQDTPVNDYHLVGAAFEVAGVGTGLGVNQWKSNEGGVSPGTYTSGLTAPLTADEIFLLGMMPVPDLFPNTANTLIVESKTPPWLEEFEAVRGGEWLGGEIDTRAISGAMGTQVEAKWTQNFTEVHGMYVVAFHRNATAPVVIAGVGHVGLEVLYDPPVTQLHLTQYAIELLTAEEPPPPTLISIVPTFGPSAGGTLVTLTGTDFPDYGEISVLFDGVPSTAVTRISDTEIQCTTPAGTTGFAEVRLIFHDVV